MKNKLISLTAALFLCVTLLPQAGSAQQLRLSVDGGLSKLVGNDYKNWNWGYTIGGQLLFHVTDNLFLGGRFAYNRWSPNKTNFLGFIDSMSNGSVNGDATIWEILPTARLTTAFPLGALNLFAQAGAGLYVVDNKTTVRGTIDTSSVSRVFGKKSSEYFGFNVGAGFTFGSPDYLSIDLYPLYNMVFLDNSRQLKYMTLNLAIAFGI